MLKLHVLNALAEPFPSKCQLLNSLLETSNLKDLQNVFELIVNSIFSYTTLQQQGELNLSDINNNFNATQQPIRTISNEWPLKQINKVQNGFEYDCIFNFLNSSSSMWLTMFKLDNLGAKFQIQCQYLPAQLRFIIENNLSSLSLKVDAFNNLILNAVEFYLINFFVHLYDTRYTSRRVYNEFYGNIELDSVYADLLKNYLNFFLPITQREVNMPVFFSSPTLQSTSKPTQTPLPQRTHHQSLFKRVIQKSLLTNEAELTMISNDNDRMDDIMKKVDLFLRLINECLVYPFTDSSSLPTCNQFDQQIKQQSAFDFMKLPMSPIQMKSTKKSLSPSLLKYNDPKHNIANIELIFAMSMIVKHSHFFSNPNELMSQTGSEKLLIESPTSQQLHSPSGSKFQAASHTTLDELRSALFKLYWRKSFYKFFLFHMEHWPLVSSIKWIIELWFTYIQPWKFSTNMQIQCIDEFIKENYLIYVDIYQLIMRRFCLLDMSNEENLKVLQQIFTIFLKHKEQIKKYGYLFTNVYNQFVEQSADKHEFQHMLRHNVEYRHLYNVFIEFDKPIYLFRSLQSADNMKLMSSFYDILMHTKKHLSEQVELKNKPQGNIFKSIYKSIFEEDRTVHINVQDLNRICKQIDELIRLMQEFYKSDSNYYDEANIFDESTKLPSSLASIGSYETTLVNHVQTREEPAPSTSAQSLISQRKPQREQHRLTPQDRFQVIYGLKKPVIVNYYDPDQAPVSEFENKYLVFILKFISDVLNDKYGSTFERLYNRTDFVGKLANKVLYGTKKDDYSTRMGSKRLARNLADDLIEQDSQEPLRKRARLSLRHMASYKFIFYFSIFLILTKTFSGYSFLFTFFLVCILFFIYSLYIC